MNTNIFRKSSIDRANSPEQLNEYIRVANPGVWLVLAAVVVLLIGVVIWGIFGKIETKIETGVIVEGDVAVCYVSAEDASQLREGLTVSVGDSVGTVKNVATVPVQINEAFADYMLYLTGLEKGDFCYAVEVEVSGVPDGIYAAMILVESTHPISFVIH